MLRGAASGIADREKGKRAKARRGENQRRRDSLKIPKSLPKCDRCIFYRAWGIANGFSGPPCIESLRAFYRPVAADVTPADLDFIFSLATQRTPRRGLKSIDFIRYSFPNRWNEKFSKNVVLKISVSRAIFPPNRNNHWWIQLIIHDFFFSLKSKSNILLSRHVSEKQKNVTHWFWRHTYTQLSIQNIF